MNRALAIAAAAVLLAGCSDTSSPTAAPDADRSPVTSASSDTAEADGSPTEAAASEPAAESAGAAPTTSVTPTPTPSPSPTPVVAAFDAQRAHDFAVALAALGPREAGTDGDTAGQAMIADALTAAGWTVTTEEVPLPQGGTTNNIVAVRDADDLQQRHVVVGGHHDTIGGPGANDNASGIGVLVAMAEELADETPPVPIALVAFGAEEYQPAEPRAHHLGSAAYVDLRGELVVAAAIVDMVGNGDSHCICWLDVGPRTMADRYLAAAQQEGLASRVAVEARGDISDHGPFARAGIPAAFLWSYQDGRKHTPDDTAEHLVVDDLDRAGRIALAFLRSLNEADSEGLQPSP